MSNSNEAFLCLLCGSLRRARRLVKRPKRGRRSPPPSCCGRTMYRLGDRVHAEAATKLSRAERLVWIKQGMHVFRRPGRRWTATLTDRAVARSRAQVAAPRPRKVPAQRVVSQLSQMLAPTPPPPLSTTPDTEVRSGGFRLRSFRKQRFFPSPWLRDGLEEVVVFARPGRARRGVPGGSVWVYRGQDYRRGILGGSIGCGITLFITQAVSVDEDLARAASTWVGHSAIRLGGGDHFISLCTRHPLAPRDTRLLAVHWHDTRGTVPTSFVEAAERQQRSADRRREYGEELLQALGIAGQHLRDYPHNTVVREEGKTIYARGAVRTAPDGDMMLLALNPYDGFYNYVSKWDRYGGFMQHCTGRCGPALRSLSPWRGFTCKSVTAFLVAKEPPPALYREYCQFPLFGADLRVTHGFRTFLLEQSCVGFSGTELLIRGS